MKTRLKKSSEAGSGIVKELESYFDRLWPICRSITGHGFRQSLDILSEIFPTHRLKFPTGQKVFDWSVPKEWVVRDAYLTDPTGKKRADFKANNLHLVNYSVPFQGKISLKDLKPHLHSLPELPTAIPYLTTYFKEQWGFCMADEEMRTLPEGMYQVFIDTELKNGHVEIGETVIEGETKEEVLFSSYLCHPSMANNELSGPLTLAFLYRRIKALPKRKYTYRFAIMPETIGAICYLTERGEHFRKYLLAGYQLTWLASPQPFTYKKSMRGDSLADRAASVVLRDAGAHEVLPFNPSMGSDERQYCSQGFNFPVGCLMRGRYQTSPEYHTSLDNKNFIRFEALEGSVNACVDLTEAIELNETWSNTVKFCEPQLGKRGLYPSTGGAKSGLPERQAAMLWVLNLADGTRDLLKIADESGQPLKNLIGVVSELSTAGLLERSHVQL